MLVLTDIPEGVGRLLPEGEWARRGREDLSDQDRKLWKALVPAGDPWSRYLSVLPPDSPWAQANSFWSRLVLISEAPASQFDALNSLFRQGDAPPGPVATIALTGRKFHGHRGRPWEVTEGNLHMSVALMPHLPVASLGMAFNMLPAVAVVDAIRRTTGGAARVGIKWVNDILERGRKIGGVLATTQTRGEMVESAVLGIGLNISSCPDVEPTVFVPEAGCLNEAPGVGRISLRDMLPAVLATIAERYRNVRAAGPGSLLEEYRRGSLIIGRQVRIWTEEAASGPEEAWPAPLAAGVVRTISADLSLLIEGRNDPVTKGRLAFEEVCRNRGL